MADKKTNGGWAIGGGVLIGVGVGFFFLQSGNALYFVGSILAGLGLGILAAGIIDTRK